MNATPEVFAHLTHFLMQLAKGKLCVILEVKTLETYSLGKGLHITVIKGNVEARKQNFLTK